MTTCNKTGVGPERAQQAQQRAAAQLDRTEALEQQLKQLRQLPEAKHKPRVRKTPASSNPTD
jgi:hypothetical protein